MIHHVEHVVESRVSAPNKHVRHNAKISTKNTKYLEIFCIPKRRSMIVPFIFYGKTPARMDGTYLMTFRTLSATASTREGSLRSSFKWGVYPPEYENMVKLSNGRKFSLFCFGATHPAVPSWYRPSPGRNYCPSCARRPVGPKSPL